MHCYFHLVNGDETVQHDTGVEVADILAVQHIAHRAIDELRAGADRVNEEWRGWRLNVLDPSGRVLLSVSLDLPLQYEPTLTQGFVAWLPAG
jgi:hypothetical protein